MAYHATTDSVNIEGNRVARIEKIDWDSDGTPSFPRPHGYGVLQAAPSGQTYV